MAKVLTLTFTNAAGQAVTRSAGPDLALVPSSATWEARLITTLMTLAKERSGTTPANTGAAVQNLVDRFYEWLRAEEKRIRTNAAVASAQTAEDAQVPDET